MNEPSMPKRVSLGGFALATLLVPIVFGTVSGPAVAQSDRDVVPLVRIAPNYPPEALAARREGHVMLLFTITAQGTVRDAVVVESSSPEFEAPALAALSRWRYEPALEGATPVERRDVRTVIRFALQRDPTPAPN